MTWPGLWLNKKRPVWCEVEFEDENGEKKVGEQIIGVGDSGDIVNKIES